MKSRIRTLKYTPDRSAVYMDQVLNNKGRRIIFRDLKSITDADYTDIVSDDIPSMKG